MSQYKVAKGVLRRPRVAGAAVKAAKASDFVGQGELVPEGMLSPDAITNLLERGIIEEISLDGRLPAGQAFVTRGKWSVDPASLVGKTLEDLVVMVLEIDEAYDVESLDTVVAAVTQLTADWNPAFRDELTRSTDRTRPAPLRNTTKRREDGVIEVRGAIDAGERQMSDVAKAALESARARANAKAPQES